MQELMFTDYSDQHNGHHLIDVANNTVTIVEIWVPWKLVPLCL